MKISIKCTKNIEEYIKIDTGIAGTCYSYIYIDDLAPCMSRVYGDICPVCGEEKTSEWTRTVGFYTPIKTWSKERKEEYKLRDWHNITTI